MSEPANQPPEGNGGDSRQRPRSRPNRPEGAGEKASQEVGQARAETLLKNVRSLERLRDRVEAAASELQRLKHENAVLAEKVRKLEAGGIGEGSSGIAFEERPEELRNRLRSFIEAIDQYIEQEEP